MRRFWNLIVGLALLSAATAASAQQTLPNIFSNPQVVPTPQNPQSVSLQLMWNGCGGWNPNALTVSQVGATVTVAQGGVDYVGLPCSPAGAVLLLLGSFPPGTYSLVFQAVHFVPGVGTYPPLTTQFTVGSQTVAVPAIGRVGSLMLAAMLLLVGCSMRLRRRTV